jgi:hypothetical protein
MPAIAQSSMVLEFSFFITDDDPSGLLMAAGFTGTSSADWWATEPDSSGSRAKHGLQHAAFERVTNQDRLNKQGPGERSRPLEARERNERAGESVLLAL